jgi:DNA-binding transcriptional LysR family regulator
MVQEQITLDNAIIVIRSIKKCNLYVTRNLDLAIVRTFVTVADCGSMTIAANLLYMTQGAVSQQVKRLEDSLGAPLFARKARKLELSRYGEQFIAKARQMLRLNDEILSEMTSHLMQCTLRLGVPYDLVTPLGPVMKAFAEVYPQVEIVLHCAASPALHEAVKSGLVDLAIVEYLEDEAQGDLIRVEPLVWVKSPDSDLLTKRPLPLSMVDEKCAFRSSVLGALDAAGIAWRTVFESGSIEATAATVRANLAITTWLASTVPPDLEIVPPGVSGLPRLPSFSICLLMLPNALPVATEFSRYTKEMLS